MYKKNKNRVLMILVLTLLVSSLTACSTNKTDANSNSKGSNDKKVTSAVADNTEPQYGGNITLAESADPQNINPLYVVDQTSFDIQQAIYVPFFEIIKGDIYYGNGLLESITPNQDSTEFTLKLKQNLKWHDNEPITADDIVFTINTLVDKKQNVPYQSYGYIDGKAIQVEKVDDLTAVIKLPTASAGFLGGLSQIYCIPKHIYEGVKDIGKSDLNNKPIGSGPFKFKEYKPGQSFVVERFDNYFDGKPYLDTITFKIVKDANSANASLANGEIQGRLINSEDYDTVKSYGTVNINSYNSGRVNALGFNQLNDNLKDVKVRQAIAYALNKEELVKFAYLSDDFATAAYSIFTPDTLYYDDSLTKQDNDIEKAKALLKEAGKSNLKLNILYISTDKTMESEATYIKEKLKEININIELYPLDESTYKNKIKEKDSKDYDLVLQFYTLGEEPSLYADIASGSSRSNYSHIEDKDLDNLWNEGNTTSDATKRGEVYKQIQQKINDNMYLYPIAYSNGFYAVNKDYAGFDKAILKTIYYDYSKIYKVK
ncbi:ABC transporter substrate-binding protein [Anaeromicropila herbilytica]|uniref:Peptide ABC transporter substrate-binding protein n=1 Tax=Anaeromicropila herbilytica TaxID=2785025 RepID=A0A7R7ENL8_9FIRM|nr:ABC transporter substrate-binding protein [Anaeromicropila herbilytica]BCN32186.1 peptide ABC transporter substrate-binding protein [Anaeromicropila herbilytica]